jgi:DNA primase
MVIHLSHFDTKLRQDLELQEPIKNCLAEYLFPDAQFALGEINPKSVTAKDLREYKGMTLQFSSGKRMYFSSLPVRDLVYPNPSDSAAYGSLIFTPCQKFSEIRQARVLVIDDVTGENGGILPTEQAKKLVGDCHGKLSLELAEELTGKKNAPFQFRLGIKPQQGSEVHRIGKGTLAPDPRLETLTSEVVKRGGISKTGYDIILPISSFKGRKGETAIQPREYILDLGIGVKTLAEYGKQSLGAQVLVNYPKGVQTDLLPLLYQKADELSKSQGDLYALAKYFLKNYQERGNVESENLEDLEGFTVLDAWEGEENKQSQQRIFYDLLKTDLEHHGQLLEHPFVIDELQKFLQKQWMDIATGRAIKFQSALAQPSLDLQEDEVCVPKIPDGVELIVTRSPLVNSNGVITLKNRHVRHLMRLEGSIHIHPDTAAKHLQGDFDGDRLAFEQADKYPTLTAEIQEALLPENRYPDVIKKAKVPYQGSFEQIAVSAVRNDIGKIANQIMRAVTLRWETMLMPEEKQEAYVKQVAQYYRVLLKKAQITEQEQEIAQSPPNSPSTQPHTPRQEERALAERRPTLTFTAQEHWDLEEESGSYPTLTLAIPVEVAEEGIKFLRDRVTTLAVIPPSSPQVRLESEKGYVLVKLREQDISDNLRQTLERQKGKPLDLQAYRQAIASLPPPPSEVTEVLKTFDDRLAQIAAASIAEEFSGAVLPEEDVVPRYPFIQESHRQEWLNSGVDPDIIHLNVRSLSGTNPYDYLLYSDELDRKNDGRLTDYWLKRYSNLESGGWWCSGVDLIRGDNALWGCFKPDNPRSEVRYEKVRAIKYEHPPKQPTEVFALKVSSRIWGKIAQSSGVSQQGEDFWQWVKDHPQVPLVITEGAKKAGAILSVGYASIALPGVDNGYRQDYDEAGGKVGERYLIPQLEVLAAEGREIIFAFDNDSASKPEAVARVSEAIARTALLFEQKGANVSVMSWEDSEEKGVDDLIANQGEAVFLEHLKSRQPFQTWLEARQPHAEVMTCKYPAREIDTKLGRRINAVFVNEKGEDVTVWAEPSHQSLRSAVRGEKYSVLGDAKGNLISIDKAPEEVQPKPAEITTSSESTLSRSQGFRIPQRYGQEMEEIANLPDEFLTERLKNALQLISSIQYKIVADLSNELQVAVDGLKNALRPDQNILKICKAIGGYQPVAWLTGRDKSRNPEVYRSYPLATSNYSPVDLMVQVANAKWQENRLAARPVVQFRSFFPEVDDSNLTEIGKEIKEAYNDYLKSARSLEDLKEAHPELLEPYIEVTSPKSQKTLYLTRLDRFDTLESGIISQKTVSTLDLHLVPNQTDPDIPNSLLATTTVIVAGEETIKVLGAVALSSQKEYGLQPGMKITQGLAILRSGITDERIQGIYKTLNEYVEMVRREHPQEERQQLTAALWRNAHTKDDYQTKKALLAFKVFPDEVLHQLEELQFRELRAVGLHFPSNEYGNKQWSGEVVDCEIALHPIPNKFGQPEQKRVIKVAGKVLAPLDSASPAFALGTKFQAALVAEPSSGVIATTSKGNTLKITQVRNFAYRSRDWHGEEARITVSLVRNGKGRETPLVTLDGNALGVLDKESEQKLREANLLSYKGLNLVVNLENTPPTTAQVRILPDIVVYPWQQREREQEQEQTRSLFREVHESYQTTIRQDPAWENASHLEVDLQVTIQAYRDNYDYYQVATILSQGDQVREWKASVPSSLSHEEYLSLAKDYVLYLQNYARNSLERTCQNRTPILK